MSKRVSLFSVCLLALVVTGCTASRPPSYGLPSADSIVPGVEYTVGRNENVYAIAQKNGVKLRDIIALNQLQAPFALKPGQVITLPATDQFAAPIPKAAPMEYIDKGYMAPTSNGNGGSAGVTVVQAEELAPLSGSNVSSAPLTTEKPTLVPPPQPKTTWTGTPQSTPIVEEPQTIAPATDIKPTTTAVAPQDTTAASTAATIMEPTQQQTEESTASSGKEPSFGWPVRGTITSAFGPKGQGLDNDGINIAAPKGSPVKAADGGMVAYAGNEMKGFGNLVLIRHEGGWVTAYAHLERLVVAKDTIVAKGDMIGTVGTTGGVSSPQLHFETRRDGKPVDPEIMMK